jgi:hypothetical protein
VDSERDQETGSLAQAVGSAGGQKDSREEIKRRRRKRRKARAARTARANAEKDALNFEMSSQKEEIPSAPEMDPRMGDKTPAYMEWLAKYNPEEFKKRYAGRKALGERMPPVIKEINVPRGTKPMLPIGSDIPEDAQAKERKEEWL